MISDIFIIILLPFGMGLYLRLVEYQSKTVTQPLSNCFLLPDLSGADTIVLRFVGHVYD